jgi:hypothetical protein
VPRREGVVAREGAGVGDAQPHAAVAVMGGPAERLKDVERGQPVGKPWVVSPFGPAPREAGTGMVKVAGKQPDGVVTADRPRDAHVVHARPIARRAIRLDDIEGRALPLRVGRDRHARSGRGRSGGGHHRKHSKHRPDEAQKTQQNPHALQ